MEINGKKVADFELEFGRVFGPDDFEGWVSWAMFEDGSEATEDELDLLTDRFPDVVSEGAFDHMIGIADFMGD